MSQIPSENILTSTFFFFNKGYNFIRYRCQKHGSDLFRTKLPFGQVIYMSGKEAAKVFYDTEKFVRKNSVPKRVQKTLLGENGIQTLDDEYHAHRKAFFMSVLNSAGIAKLMEIYSGYWSNTIKRWEKKGSVLLFEETQEILCKAACEWAGIPLKEYEVRNKASDFIAMVDAFGAIGLRHWKGRFARSRIEKWIMSVIDDIRNNRTEIDKSSPAYVLSFYKAPDGNLLSLQMAAVELINIVRPIISISYYITFAALAIHDNPLHGNRIIKDEEYIQHFIDEVRRYYPFGPFTGARVKEDFEWKGFSFQKGTLVLLDIYGTNRDSRIWENGDEFRPDRFRNRKGDAFEFIPQGGGDPAKGHRCAGELVTIEACRVALKYLTKHIKYNVPNQDFEYSLRRFPTYPKSKFIITRINLVR